MRSFFYSLYPWLNGYFGLLFCDFPPSCSYQLLHASGSSFVSLYDGLDLGDQGERGGEELVGADSREVAEEEAPAFHSLKG